MDANEDPQGTEHPYPADLLGLPPSQQLLDRLARWAEVAPERVSLERIDVASNGELRAVPFTMPEILAGARRAAACLHGAGVAPGDRVLLCLGNTERFLFWFLGLHWLGAIPVPLPSISGFSGKGALLERLSRVLVDCGPRALVGDAGTLAVVTALPEDTRSGLRLLDQGALDDATAGPAACPPRRPSAQEETAFLQYTSGSTGAPRGVVVTHANLRDNHRASAQRMRCVAGDRLLSWLPLYHDMGLIGGLLFPLTCGFTALLMSPLAFMARPARWLRAASRFRATILVAPNFAYSLCLHKVRDPDLVGLDLGSVRLALDGAEPVDPATVHGFLARYAAHGLSPTAMFPVYGLAEATLSVALPHPGEPVHVEHVSRAALAEGIAEQVEGPATGVASFVSVGQAVPGHTAEIRDPATGALMPERRLGEIVVLGPSITPGYWSLTGPVGGPIEGRLRTGDLGYLAEGRLFIVDRIKDLIILGGRNLAPSDLERSAVVGGVRAGRAVAFGVHDPGDGTDGLVIVAEIAGARAAEAEAVREGICAAVRQEHGVAVREVRFARSGSLPRTSSGKLMRRRTRELYLAGGIPAPSAGQGTEGD